MTVTNKQAEQISQILLRHGIPVVSQGSLGLKDHPLITELVAFLRFLANPLDDNAFCQVLLGRSLLPVSFHEKCSVETILDFLTIPRRQSRFTLFKEKFPEIWNEYFHVLVDSANLLTAYDTLCEVYLRMDIMKNNQDAEIYLLRFKELAHLAEEQGIVDLNAFLDWWEANGENEKAPLPEGLNSVSVMTVHKSKGLEFEAVIIPYHDFSVDVSSDIQKIALPYEGKEYTLYTKLKKEHGTPYYSAMLEKIKESINVLYVAWTRAMEELHIFVPTAYDNENDESDEKNEGSKQEPFYRLINALLEETDKKVSVQKNDDYWHFGESLEKDVLSEKSLRLLEYAFYDKKWAIPEIEPENLQKYVSEDEEEKIDGILSEYTDDLDRKERTVNVLADDRLYVAMELSALLDIEKTVDSELKSDVIQIEAKGDDSKESNTKKVKENVYNQKHLMGWLPDLRIFRSDLEELQGEKELSSNKRGTLIHKSLEYLVFSGDIAEDCKRASAHAMKFLPYGQLVADFGHMEDCALDNALEVKNSEQLKALNQEVQNILTWFASLEEPFGGAKLWFQHGYKEHGIVNENGELFRVDLLVEIPKEIRPFHDDIAYVAIDYKTGYTNELLPNPSNKKQIQNYIELLQKATGEEVVGLLVYLDVQKCCPVEPE